MADPTTTIVDAPRADLAPVDPNVRVPDAVRRAAQAADAIHGQAYQPEPTPAPAPVAQPQPEPQPAPQPEPQPAPQPVPQPRAAAPADADDDLPAADALTPEQWRHRFASMRGRYRQQGETLAVMQDQLSQVGDELMRHQDLLNQRQPGNPLPQPATPAQPLVTPQDREAYGDELIDLTKRAALEAVQPVVQKLEAENETLKRRQATSDRQGVYNLLDQKVPNWRDVNNSPAFKNWLRLRDVYLGGVRQQHLDAAFKAADAPRVAAFFTNFLADEAAIGSTDLLPQPEPPAPPAPRTPAVRLDALAAPGRAKPAGGEPPVNSDKPVYTRAQISTFYANVRRGAYAGREAEKARIEADIFAAQNEGRVR